MKRTILVLLLLAGLIVVPAMAQDFSSPKPQFLSFNIGVPIGYSLDAEEFVAGRNFGVNFMVLDKLEIGFDHLGLRTNGTTTTTNYNLLRVAFSFTDMFGAAIGYGSGGNGTVSLGAFANLFQGRADVGLAYGLGFRLDYVANINNFGGGVILFTLRATFGL